MHVRCLATYSASIHQTSTASSPVVRPSAVPSISKCLLGVDDQPCWKLLYKSIILLISNSKSGTVKLYVQRHRQHRERFKEVMIHIRTAAILGRLLTTESWKNYIRIVCPSICIYRVYIKIYIIILHISCNTFL